MKKIFTYEKLRDDFEDTGEDLVSDLSGMTIAIFKDVHDESIELMVEVFGREGMDGVAILSETVCNPEDYLEERIDPHDVNAEDILGFFDDDLINLLKDKKLPIIFNRGWQTEVILNLDDLGQRSRIVIEEQ